MQEVARRIKLRNLKELLEEGLITAEDFRELKRTLLANSTAV